jgi:hypothetical protein
VDYTIAGSALAVPCRACGAVRIGGELLSELPSIGLFTRVRGRGILRTSPCHHSRKFVTASVLVS